MHFPFGDEVSSMVIFGGWRNLEAFKALILMPLISRAVAIEITY